jgi:hypothetical protein
MEKLVRVAVSLASRDTIAQLHLRELLALLVQSAQLDKTTKTPSPTFQSQQLVATLWPDTQMRFHATSVLTKDLLVNQAAQLAMLVANAPSLASLLSKLVTEVVTALNPEQLYHNSVTTVNILIHLTLSTPTVLIAQRITTVGTMLLLRLMSLLTTSCVVESRLPVFALVVISVSLVPLSLV